MKKWREKFAAGLLGLAFLALAAPTPVSGQSCNPCCDPCKWSFCNQCIEVGVDFLWWKPCIDDMDFAYSFRTSNNNTSVNYKAICPEWEPGVRVAVDLPRLYCDWSLGASWTYIKSDDCSSLEAPSGFDVSSQLLHQGLIADFSGSSRGRFKEADADWELCYHNWDVLMSYNISCNQCHEFRPFFGIAGIYLDQELKVDLTNPTGVNEDDSAEIKWDSDYWGIGFKAGSLYFYRFNDCVSFFAKADGTLLAGEACSKNKQEAIDFIDSLSTRLTIDLEDDEYCLCVPGFHLASGVVYNTCLCNYEFTLRLGYEFVQWHNIPNPRVFSGDNRDSEAAHSSSPDTRTLGFHGLFAGLLFQF